MVSVRDVETGQLIRRVSTQLKKDIKAPDWSKYVKTGAHAMRPPENADWWYVRAASLLRKVRLHGPVGVGNLRTWYGGRKNRGVRPEKHVDAGGKVIRTCLQQLEQAGYIKKEAVGRVVTPKGQALLDKTAADISKETPKPEKKVVKPKKKPTKKRATKKKAETPEAETKTEAKPTKTAAKAKPKAKKPEKPKAAEPKAEKPKEETPAKEPKEVPVEEPKPEEPKAEEPKEEAPAEEAKPEDTPAEEPKEEAAKAPEEEP